MPIYEYQCEKCGVHIEKRQSISDEPLKVCEACGGELVKKISLSGFQFKGAGWYVTDYSNKNGKKSEKTSGEGSEKSSSSESTAGKDDASKAKSDTPPTAKADKSGKD